MEDYVLPNSPFMVHPSDSVGDLQSRLGASKWVDWVHLIIASSPRLFSQLRQHLVQCHRRGGFTLIYCTIALEEAIRALQRGEQFIDTMIFQLGDLCNSTIFVRPDLLEALPQDRSKLVFIVNATRVSHPTLCYVVSSRIFNFLQLVQGDKYTGFEPWKNIQFIVEKRIGPVCNYCAKPTSVEYGYRCPYCSCGTFCSNLCSVLFIRQSSHEEYCQKLHYLMTGYHGTSTIS